MLITNKRNIKNYTIVDSTLKQSINTVVLSSIIAFFSINVARADQLSDLIQLKSQAPLVTTQTASSSSHITAPKTLDLITRQNFYQSYMAASNVASEHIDILYDAEQNASNAGRQVLQTVRKMALDNRDIIKGACWDYLNAAFNRAGVQRDTVFKGEYPNGPFVNTDEIQPGDWLYYVNHSYHDIEHSGLFVGWVNRDTNEALILSYAGEQRNEPARYKVYDVSHTYNVMRPQ